MTMQRASFVLSNKILMKNWLTILFSFVLTNVFSQGKFFGGNGDGFAVSQSVLILPVKLISFDATLQNNKAQITWTAITTQTSSFILETSKDGHHFQWLGEKTVTQNAIDPVKYSHADGPRTGLWYYRLKWTGDDGSTMYSNTLTVNFPQILKVQAWYDAAADMVTITKPANESLVQLYSTDGRLQKTMRSYQSLIRVSVDDLPAGIYIVRISGHWYTTRFLKLAN